MKRQVFLVPGFFGFTSLGALNYFHRVKETLSDALQSRGATAEIIECRTQPTGSIASRADYLLQEVLDAGGLEADELHFVGHSTGGLDVRLLLTPDVRLREGEVEDRLAARVRNAISLSTPHFGTPLASFFTTLQGRNLLRFLTVMATSHQGRYAIFLAAQATRLLATVDDKLGRRNTLLDMLSAKLLDRVSVDRDDPLWDFLEQISLDQGAVIHLTPEGMDLFNAAVTDREGVRYTSAVSAAPPPAFGQAARSFESIERATTYAVFAVLHTLSSREHRAYPYPSPAQTQRAVLQAQLPFDLDAGTNDGVIPTLSQLYGELLEVVVADHLDVVGQFRNAGGDANADWLPSGSHFDEGRFQRLWGRVADVIAAAS